MTKRPNPIPLAIVLLVASPKHARADGSISYKYEDYSEPGGRVGVHTQGVVASQDIGPDTKFGFTAVTDSIAGATPTGAPAPEGSTQVPLAHLSDHRKSWETDLSRQFSRVNLSGGISESREHDYISKGWSLNSLTDFNEKNTTLLAGVAGHEDRVETFFDPEHLYTKKHAFSAILGVTQLLDPLTKVIFNVSWTRDTGYLSDQYKVVTQTVEVVPGSFFPLVFAENRPDQHNAGVAYAGINRALPSLNAALEGSYRFFSDTFGVTANTFELLWLQKIGSRVTVSPDVRYYEQSAAKFYYYDLTQTTIVPTFTPDPSGTHYSSDYRLSSLYTTTFGIKVAWKIRDGLTIDAALDRYTMHGRDGVTPQSAYPKANIVTTGISYAW